MDDDNIAALGTEKESNDSHHKIVVYSVDRLRPHGSYVRHQIAVPAAQLSRLIELGDLAFQEPIDITSDGTIIDGYARVNLARLKERSTLLCRVHDLTEMEATQYLLHKHLRLDGWNKFTRAVVALDLEADFREKALANQRAGGRNKGSSKLTQADRVDVRTELGVAAHLSPGTLSKVKQLLGSSIPKLIQALRDGEVSIHRAHRWSKTSPEEQIDALWRYQSEKDIRKVKRKSVSPHGSTICPVAPEAGDLIRLLSALQSGKIVSVRVASVNVPGRAVFMTEELFRALGSQEELALT